MHDPYIRAEEALVSLELRTQYDEKNRLELLSVHGVKGLLLGPLLYFFGGPEAWNILFGREATVFLAAPAFFGGLLLLLGLFWHRNIILEAAGMFGLIIWDGLMVYSMLRAGQNPYTIVVYAAFAALMLVHIKTLVLYILAKYPGAFNG
jgi:hypothetical protein